MRDPPPTPETSCAFGPNVRHASLAASSAVGGGFCPAFTDTLLRLIMSQEECHGTEAEVFSGVQA